MFWYRSTVTVWGFFRPVGFPFAPPPQVLQEDVGLVKLVEIFCNENFNQRAKLNYLGPLLSNLTQLPEARTYMMDRDR